MMTLQWRFTVYRHVGDDPSSRDFFLWSEELRFLDRYLRHVEPLERIQIESSP